MMVVERGVEPHDVHEVGGPSPATGQVVLRTADL
jgi:hypothetical protein